MDNLANMIIIGHVVLALPLYVLAYYAWYRFHRTGR
jgi:hypothetical protein